MAWTEFSTAKYIEPSVLYCEEVPIPNDRLKLVLYFASERAFLRLGYKCQGGEIHVYHLGRVRPGLMNVNVFGKAKVLRERHRTNLDLDAVTEEKLIDAREMMGDLSWSVMKPALTALFILRSNPESCVSAINLESEL